MKNLYLLLFIGYYSFAQQALPYEPRTYQNEVSDAQKAEEYMRQHLKAPQNTDAQTEMSFQEKMNTLNDDKFNFEEYNIKPEQVYNELPSGELELKQPAITMSVPDSQPQKDSDLSKIMGVIFGLFCVFLTFITLLFSKRNKRF
jgi:hypothetical protein